MNSNKDNGIAVDGLSQVLEFLIDRIHENPSISSRAPAIEVMTGIASSNVGAHIKEFAIPVACMFDELGDPSSYVHPSMVQLQEWVNQLQGPLEGLFKASATSLRKLSTSEDSISILIEDFPDDYDPILAFYLLLGFAIDRTNIPVDNMYLQTAWLQFSAQLWTKNLVRGLSTVNIKMVQSEYDDVDDHETFDMTALDQLTSRFLNDAENLHSFSADCNNGISFLYRLELSNLLAKNLRHLSLTDIVIDQDFATNLGYLQQLHALKLDHSLASNIIPEFRWHDVFRALCSIHSLKLMQFSALDYFATGPPSGLTSPYGMGLYLDNNCNPPYRPLDSMDQADYDALEILVRMLLEKSEENDPNVIGEINGTYMKDDLAPHVLRPKPLIVIRRGPR